MSDWEIDNSSQNASQKSSSSDWQIDTPEESNNSRLSYGQALAQAPSKIYEDVTGGIKNFASNVPGYYQAAKTEVPGLFGNENAFTRNPKHALKQALAGSHEAINKLAQLPLNLSKYGSERLQLLPQGVTSALKKITPQDTSGAINQLFGEPNQPGEKLLRGAIRNAPDILGGAGIAKSLNPMRFTASGIAKNVLKEEKKQVNSHSKRYNQIWDEANKSGFNHVPHNEKLLNKNHLIMDKFYPEKSTLAFKKFLDEPTLAHAQSAQSDLGHLRRALEEKARKNPLLETEKSLYKVISDSEKHIEGNMFKNLKGETNNKLKNQYDKLTKSYKENVVPYRYHPAIQAFKNKEMTAKELVNALSHGSFAAKKGGKHPAIKVNQLLPKAGWLGAGALLGKELFGAGEQEKNQQY